MVNIPPEIWYVLVSGLLGIIGGWGGHYISAKTNLEATQQSIRAENKRRSADYLLQKEADAVIELFEAAEDCYAKVQTLTNRSKLDDEKIPEDVKRDALDALARFEKTARINTVFLSKDEKETVESLLGQVRMAETASRYYRQGNIQMASEMIDWMGLYKSFDDFINTIRNFVHSRFEELRENGNTVSNEISEPSESADRVKETETE